MQFWRRYGCPGAALAFFLFTASACSDGGDSPPSEPPAQAGQSRISRVEITSRVSPAFGGTAFGQAGAYELLVGKAYGVADPASAKNEPVTDLGGAPRNAQGLVEYSMDIAILKPIDASKANGTLLYEVGNRGSKNLMAVFNGGSGNFTAADGGGAGVGLSRGYTMVWSGWQGDLVSSHNATGGGTMAAVVPQVKGPNGQTITGVVRDEFTLDGQTGSAIPAIPENATSFDAPLFYFPVEADPAKFKLTVRQRADDAPVELPSSQMAMVGPKTVRVQLAQGFDLGAIYDITYTARDPMAAGLSFVSVRDFISFLRHSAADDTGQANPLAVAGRPALSRTIAIGLSQSGRYQRDFIYLGFNSDERGRKVFDGMLPQGAGAKRGFFHQRFAEATRSPDVQHEHRGYPGAQFPFTYGTLTDPFLGKTDGILARCSANDSCPKIMHLDSDWEQWQQAASLVVTDPLGRAIELPAAVRAYYVAGAPHSNGAGIASGAPLTKGICEYPQNGVSWAPVLRALVVAMDDWLRSGTEPPASRYPATAAQGRLSIDALRNSFPVLPDYRFNSLYGKLQLIDFTQNPPVPIAPSAPYPIGVLRVNSDGNPYDGIVLPELAVPIATYSGRNTRGPRNAPGELCGTHGHAIAFAKTQADRSASGDPRPSLAERYGSDAEYRARLKTAADALVAQRFMLPADAANYANYALPR